MRRDVFQAIADPTRRAILELLSGQSRTVNQIAEHFDISRPAISKHLKVLTECGLVVMRKRGRERYCEARLDKLQAVSDWVEPYRQAWQQRFNRLDKLLEEIQNKEQ